MDTQTLLLIGTALAALAVVLLIVLLLRRPERALENALREEQREGRGELRGQLADSIQRTDARLDDLRAALSDDAHKARSGLAARQQQFEESLAARLRELGDRNAQTLGELRANGRFRDEDARLIEANLPVILEFLSASPAHPAASGVDCFYLAS